LPPARRRDSKCVGGVIGNLSPIRLLKARNVPKQTKFELQFHRRGHKWFEGSSGTTSATPSHSSPLIDLAIADYGHRLDEMNFGYQSTNNLFYGDRLDIELPLTILHAVSQLLID